MYSDDKAGKLVDTKTVGNSGVTYRIDEYNTSEGKIRQLRVDLKGGRVVVENGTILAVEQSIRLNKEERVRMPGGKLGIPEELQDYFKPDLEGDGNLFLNPTNKYISILPVDSKTGLIIERGGLLACDGLFNKKGEDGGFEVVTSWNKNLRSNISNYRDLTTTVLKGRGAIVLELDMPLSSLVQYDINSPVILNEDAVVMRSIGLERKALSEEDSEYFSDYSGVEGKGVKYSGRGRLWLYPGNALPSKTDNKGVLNKFIVKKEEETAEEIKKKRGINILDKRR